MRSRLLFVCLTLALSAYAFRVNILNMHTVKRFRCPTGIRSVSEETAAVNSAEDGKESKKEKEEKEEKLGSLIGQLVEEVRKGNIDELSKKGFGVSDTSNGGSSLDSKLFDPDLQADVFGSLKDDEAEEIGKLIEQAKQEVANAEENRGSSSMLKEIDDIDGALIAKLKKEARETMKELRDDKSFMTEEAASTANSVSGGNFIDTNQLGPGVETVLSIPAEDSFTGAGTSTSTDTNAYSGFHSSSSGSVPDVVFGSQVREEEEEIEEEKYVVPAEAPASVGAELISSNEGEEGTGKASDVETTFTELLKATIEDASSKGELSQLPEDGAKNSANPTTSTTTTTNADDNLVSSTVNAIQENDMEALDVKGILGEALFSLSESMGIDVEKELQSGQSKIDIQNIMTSGMTELTENMKQLDEESLSLYDKLESLKQELQIDAEKFEEEKQLELDDLLSKQSELKDEFSKSQEAMRVSTDKLDSLMKDLNENADIITSLALFRLKSVDQKLAFVVGLSLLFKVPFDVTQLVAIRSGDFTDWFSILTQTGVCLACFNHYGILRAAFVSLTKSKK